MIYLQYFCCCVDLRLGAMIIGVLEILMDVFFGSFIAMFGKAGKPDLAHILFLLFLFVHLLSVIFLIIGTIKLKPRFMLFYILITIFKILLILTIFIADILLEIWIPILVLYVIMFFSGAYFWLVIYSFYAALGGCIFI